MGEMLELFSYTFNAIPKINQSLFRINRDTRFSKNKTPYKTHMGIWFWEGSRKRMDCSGFYFQYDAGKILFGSGLYIFSKELLDLYRDAVVHKIMGKELKSIVEDLKSKGYNIGGKHYKKVPRGYDKDHKNVEFLLYNGLHCGIEFDLDSTFFTPEIIDTAFSHFKNMLPFHLWLKKIIGE